MYARGFTLIELLVVIVIVSILATVGVVHYMGVLENARRDTATAVIGGELKTAAALYKTRNGKYPESLAVLTQRDPRNSGEFYLDKVPPDPWGHPYVYEKTSEGYRIKSYGSDGAPGGDGSSKDIVVEYPSPR